MGDLFDGARHGFGDHRRAAEGRAGLNEEGNVGVVLFKVVNFEDALHGLAGVFNADAVGGENLFGGFVIDGFRLFQDPLEVFVVGLFQVGDGRNEGFGGEDFQIEALDKPFAQIGL